MATVTKTNARNLPEGALAGVPWGDLQAFNFKLQTSSSGYMTDSDQPAAVLAIADKVRLGILPAGMNLIDSLVIISDAFTASTTYTLGFEYVDGVDSTAVPQDVDYFNAAVASSALAVQRKTGTTAPVTLPKDAYLILTVAAAAHASAGIMDITIFGVRKG